MHTHLLSTTKEMCSARPSVGNYTKINCNKKEREGEEEGGERKALRREERDPVETHINQSQCMHCY